jgi:hypothetical protein
MGISRSLGRETERRRAEERQSIELSRSPGPTNRFQQVRRRRTNCPRRSVSPLLLLQHLGQGIFRMQSALWLRLISHAQTCLRTASQIMYSVAPLVPRLVPGTGLTLRRPFISLPNTNLHRVIYFNLGSHHVPHSGDIPNTLMHTSASSVMFTPFNFHDRDPSRHSVQGVRLNLGGEHPEPRYFGGRHEKDVNLKVVSLTTIMCGKSVDSIRTHEWGKSTLINCIHHLGDSNLSPPL